MFRNRGTNRYGKPTNTRYVLSLTKEKLMEEYELIKQKKSELSADTRGKIVFFVENILNRNE